MQTQKRHTADASGTPLNGVASSGTPPRHTIQWSCFNRHTADASGTPLMRMSVSVFIIATLYYSQSGPRPARCFSFLIVICISFFIFPNAKYQSKGEAVFFINQLLRHQLSGRLYSNHSHGKLARPYIQHMWVIEICEATMASKK